MDAARSAAYDVLTAVRVDDAYTNLVLPHVLRAHGLTGRDAAFTTELASGTIRRQGTYDAIVKACLHRPKVEAKVLDALRLGAHQLLSMRVPTHAAISTTVDLVRVKVGPGPAGFTNAVLRRVAEHNLDGWVRRVAPDPAGDPIGFASIAHSHPRWIVGRLRDALLAGRRDGDLDALLTADNAAPKVMLVAQPGLSTVEELVSAGGTPARFSPYGVELGAGDPADLPAVAEGRAGVQDEGSQLVALGLASMPMSGRDERWLDLCAGPGGKSTLLAALARDEAPSCWPRTCSTTAPVWSGAAPGRCPAACSGWSPPTRRCRLGGLAASTGSWSTSPAPGWVRSAAAPSPGGGVPRPTSSSSCPSNGLS